MSAHLFPSSLPKAGRAADETVRPHPPLRPVGLIGTLLSMARIIGSRQLLAQLDDRMLSDIGISRGEALEEAARMPWDTTTWRSG